MLGQVLIIALAAQAALGAPSGCTEFCDDSQPVLGSTSYNGAKSSYSSYSKSSYGSSYSSRPSAVVGLGSTGGRLETLDENVIGGQPGLNRPGSWRDEKHYITDDGHGQMSYRAGQTVSDNGFSKFAEHSYSYGSHDSHAPLANSQILSTSEFNRELQSMRSRIASFMGSYALGSNFGVPATSSSLQEFKRKAGLISSQMNDVCNQVDVGSSMYQQMQQMMQQFQRDVETRQREMEAVIFSSTSTRGSFGPSTVTAHYPTVQTSPAEVENIYHQQQELQKQVRLQEQLKHQQQQQQLLLQQQQQQERIENQIAKIQGQISTFYTTFNRPDTSVQYQQDLNSQVDTINQQLTELSLDSYQNESERQRIEQIKTQFESYVGQIRSHIQDLENRNREEEARRRDREQKLQLEKQQREERIRAEQEAQNLRLQQEEEQRVRLQQEEEQRAQLAALQQQQQAQQHVQQQAPHHVTGSVQVSSSYEHSIKGTYGSQTPNGGSSSSGYRFGSERYTRPSQPMQPHVDMTAAMSRLQQDLNRLQTQVNNFNVYTMRLTAGNSASVVNEAEREANNLRQNLENLCESSNSYQNEGILSSAENLRRRFEEMFRSFQSQAASYTSGSGYARSAGYSASSSYGASGYYSASRAPRISNVEYEHSKSTDVELLKRPSSSQRYTNADVDCVESYAGQPCVNQPARYRRDTSGEKFGPFFYRNIPLSDYSQQNNPIFDDIHQTNRNSEVLLTRQEEFSQMHLNNERYSNLRNKPYPHISKLKNTNSELEGVSQSVVTVELPSDDQTVQKKELNTQIIQRLAEQKDQKLRRNHSMIVDLTKVPNAFDDYYRQENSNSQINRPSISTDNLSSKQRLVSQDLSQQINSGLHEEFKSLENFSNEDLDDVRNVRIGIQQPISRNLEINGDYHKLRINDQNAEPLQKVEKFEYDQDHETSTIENGFTHEISKLQKDFHKKNDLQLSEYEQTQKLENFNNKNLSQQTLSQIDINHENNERLSSTHKTLIPERFIPFNNDLGKFHSAQKHENKTNIPRKKINSSESSDEYASKHFSLNSQSEQILNSTESNIAIEVPNQTPIQKPKLASRYARPWQVSQIHNIPNSEEYQQKPKEDKENNVTQKFNSSKSANIQFDLDKTSRSFRGDLPGILNSFKNESLLNQLSTSNHSNKFNNQRIQHNYKDSQQSNSDNQQKEIDLSQSIESSIKEDINFNQKSLSTQFDKEQENIYQFHEPTESNYYDQQSIKFEPNYQLELNKQTEFNQHIEQPSIRQYNHNDFSQRKEHQEDFSKVIPLNKITSMKEWPQIEPTTTPQTLLKKIGQKLTKVKDKIKSIFG